MKIFETPLMNISVFDVEDVITTSGVTGAQTVAENDLTTSGSGLLNGKQALSAESIISFSF